MPLGPLYQTTGTEKRNRLYRTVLGPGPLLLCWQQPPEGPGALCWQLPHLPATLGGLPTAMVQDKVHSTPEHSQGMRVPEGPSCQCVLVPHILPDVSLVEHHDGQRVDLPALLCGLGSHSEALGDEEEVREVAHLDTPAQPWQGPGAHQRDVGHGIHHNTLVLRRVLRDAAQARLQHVVAVEEGLL